VTGCAGSPIRVRLIGNESRNRGWRRAVAYSGLGETVVEAAMVHSGMCGRSQITPGQCLPRHENLLIAIYDGHACRGGGARCRVAQITSINSLLSTGF